MANDTPAFVQQFIDQSGCYVCFGSSVEQALQLGALKQIIDNGGVAPLPIPVLTLDAACAILSWSVVLAPQPFLAKFEFSTDGINWGAHTSVFWSTGSAVKPSGFYWRVYGVNNTGTNVTQYSNIVFISIHATAAAWALQVVANGGAAPTDLSIQANSDFMYAIDCANVTPSLVNINTYSTPGNIIGAMTPLVNIDGPALWTGFNFTDADITVHGLQGNGVDKYADTGVVPTHYATAITDGLYLYVQGNNGVAACQGECSNSQANPPPLRQSRLYYCNEVRATFHCTPPGGGAGPDMVAAAGTFSWRGFIGAAHLLANLRNLYLANTTNPLFIAYTDAVPDNGIGPGPVPSTMPVFCSYEAGPGIPTLFSAKRHSFMAFGIGLDQTDVTALYNAIVALRTTLGGGLDTGPNSP